MLFILPEREMNVSGGKYTGLEGGGMNQYVTQSGKHSAAN